MRLFFSNPDREWGTGKSTMDMKARKSNSTSGELNCDRRRFLRNAALTFAAAELATIGSASGQSSDADTVIAPATRRGAGNAFTSIKQVDAGVLSIGYADVGRPDG